MAAVNITDLNNAKTDVDHIADFADSPALIATDRLGHIKRTIAGIDADAQAAIDTIAANGQIAVDTVKAINNRGAWVTGTAYAVKDIVSSSGTWYVCVVAHTSSAALATDLPTKWRVYQGIMAADLSAPSGAGIVGWIQVGFGAVFRWVLDKLRERVSFADFGVVGDGVADDTAAILNAITRGVVVGSLKGTAGTFKITAPINFNNVNFEGEGIGKTVFNYYGAGTGVLCNSSSATTCKGFSVISKAAGQNGFHAQSGTGSKIGQIYCEDFDGFGARIGNAPTAGVYFSDIDYIQCNNPTRTGASGFIVDGGTLPSSNANLLSNIFVKGKWTTLYDIRGNKNIFLGGDAEPNNSAAAITQVFLVSGLGNDFRGMYWEALGATQPATYVNFTSTSAGNIFSDTYIAATVPAGGLDRAIVDAGIGNEVRVNPNGFNFPFASRRQSPGNLIANSGFRTLTAAGMPVGWAVESGAGFISRDAATIRGGKYSIKMNVTADKAGLSCWIATNNPVARLPLNPVPITRLRGRTVMAGVWCLSTTAGMGSIKIYDGVLTVGKAAHSGSGAWELLTAVALVNAAATEACLTIRTDTANAVATGIAYFSEPMLVIGTELPLHAYRSLNDNETTMGGRFALNPPIALTVNSTTPDVSDANVFTEANTGATRLSNFLGGSGGQEIVILTTSANTTLGQGGNIQTNTGADHALAINRAYRLVHNGTKWVEY